MASSLKSGKQSVTLPASAVRVSRIRRDPPPKVKVKEVDLDVVDRRDVIIGVLAFALAICVITLAFSSYSAWSPTEYSLELNSAE